MSIIKLTDKITSVGVINPNLRVFDVVIPADYGTSYNAYILQGNDKTALIECSHDGFSEQFLRNIRLAIGEDQLDYIILNHCEPDHSGALACVMEHYPQAQVIASQAGALYLKNITKTEGFSPKAVKQGDTLDLGGLTLEFIPAPFLHWPDSMFTWVKEENALFSCDFLGAHYCEPNMLDTEITYPECYQAAFRVYYDGIFAPFKKYVLAGLDKIKDLDIAFVCNSHGPVLTKDCLLPKAMELYRSWSTPEPRANKLIPVFYVSAYGNTEKLAHAIAKGIREAQPAAEVECYDIIKHDLCKLSELINACDAFAVGSPTFNRDAVAPVWHLLTSIDAVNSAKKPALVFGSYGWSGEAAANLSARLNGLKIAVHPEPVRVCFTPAQQDLDCAAEQGKKFAMCL